MKGMIISILSIMIVLSITGSIIGTEKTGTDLLSYLSSKKIDIPQIGKIQEPNTTGIEIVDNVLIGLTRLANGVTSAFNVITIGVAFVVFTFDFMIM